jgi:hypothetical protein
MTRYISVQYKSKFAPDTFGSREYTYIDGIGDLAVGDLVIAPAGKGQSTAQVSKVDVPESKIDERVMPLLKTVTERYQETGDDGSGDDDADESEDDEPDRGRGCGMRIKALTLENFQGVRQFTLNLDGQSASVYGENATGKTTLYNAYTWLLFDRASDDDVKGFTPKTNGRDGKKLHHLDHSVAAELILDDGRIMTLKKVYREVYKNSRGGKPERADGHTTDHFIDDVPIKNKKDYDRVVNEICGDPERVKILTMPDYFPKVLHWEKRRRILMDVCGGDVTDADVLADPELAELPEYLKKPGAKGQLYTVDEYKAIAAVQRSEITKQLQIIPGRIDEAARLIRDISDTDPEAIDEKLSQLTDAIQECEREKAEARSGGDAGAAIRKLIANVKAEISEARAAYLSQSDAANQHIRDLNNKVLEKSLDKQADVDRLQSEIARQSHERERVSQLRQELMDKYVRVSAVQWDESESICPTCNRPLPESDIENLRERFNLEKSKELEAINQRGKNEASKQIIEAITEKIQKLEEKLAKEKAKQKALDVEFDKNRKQITHLPPFEKTEIYAGLNEKLVKLQPDATNIGACANDDAAATDAKLAKLRDEFTLCNKQKSDFAIAESTQERIAELERQEKDLDARLEIFEKGLHLCDQFTKSKVAMLTDKINRRFKNLCFQLSEGCEAMVPGPGNLTPFTDANTGAKMLAGLEIINTMAAHWGMSLPLFVDNAESVTGEMETDGQIIRLFASKTDQSLRVELDNKDAA